MKEITKKHLKKYGWDVVGVLLITAGAVSFISFIPGSTYLMFTGLTMIIGKRSVNRFKRHVLPWLKEKHARHKKRKLARAKLAQEK